MTWLVPAATQGTVNINRGIELLHLGFGQVEAGVQGVALREEHFGVVGPHRFEEAVGDALRKLESTPQIFSVEMTQLRFLFYLYV